MGWMDKVASDGANIVITTGDEKNYDCLFKRPSITHDFKATALEFVYEEGAKVIRAPRGLRAYPIEIYFQGDDHLDVSAAFIESANNLNSWVLTHPYYDEDVINCHPTTLEQDNSIDGLTKFTGILWESTDYTNGRFAVNPLTGAIELHDNGFLVLENAATGMVADAGEAASIANNIQRSSSILKKGVSTDFDLGKMNEAIAKVDATINRIGTDPVLFMNNVANVLRAPSRFYNTMKKRIEIIKESFTDLQNAVKGIPGLAERVYFELGAAMMVLASSEVLLSPMGDIAKEQNITDPVTEEFVDPKPELTTRAGILEQATTLNALLEDYITTLESLQSEQDNRLDSYYPDPYTIQATIDAVDSTISNLFTIAAGARQERTYTLPEDMIIIELTHMLRVEDVEDFIKSNNITMDEHVVIKKGRKVTYYV